jgi:hypothetical protein
MAVEPIDPAAGTAASLLAAGSVDEHGQAETSAWPGQALLAALVQRAVADHDVRALPDEVTTRPQDPNAIGAPAHILTTLAAEDRTFRGELARLVGLAEHDPAIGALATIGSAKWSPSATPAPSTSTYLPAPPSPTVLERLHRAQSGGPVVANLPPCNPTFTGREKLLDQLHARLPRAAMTSRRWS